MSTRNTYEAIFGTSNTVEYTLPPTYTRMTDGSVQGMRFYPPEIVNTAKGYAETAVIDVSDGTNFVNPQKSNTAQLTVELTNLIDTCNNSGAADIKLTQIRDAACNVRDMSLLEFDRHTDRLTGQIAVGSPLPEDVVPAFGRNVPYLLTLSSIGKSTAFLNYVNTGEKNEEELNEAYGSVLFDFSSYANTVLTINNAVSSNLTLGPEPGIYIFTMSEAYANTLTNTLIQMSNSFDQNRTDDENVYATYLSTMTSTSFTGNTGILSIIANIQSSLVTQSFNYSQGYDINNYK